MGLHGVKKEQTGSDKERRSSISSMGLGFTATQERVRESVCMGGLRERTGMFILNAHMGLSHLNIFISLWVWV